MEFGEVETKAAAGKILAHSAKTPGKRLPKGTLLDENHIALLSDAGVAKVMVATINEGEIREDEAAQRIAMSTKGKNLRVGKPTNGRANLFSETAGLFRVDATKVNGLNAIDPALTLATLRDREHVEKGRLVATVKVIPFAARQTSVEEIEEMDATMNVAGYLDNKVAMVQTRLPAIKDKALDKTLRVTKDRLESCNSRLVCELRCDHSEESLLASMKEAMEKKPDILLVSGASAVCDEKDVIPAAIRKADGEVRRVGMPVDPGNLLVVGRIGKTAVIGLPGCARSPKENGFDWVLRRLCAGECITEDDIANMGVGGLLEETIERSQPRLRKKEQTAGPLAAILLAAGLSTRMGEKNKLLEPWKGEPLIFHAAKVLSKGKEDGLLAKVFVVTGNDQKQVEESLSGLDLLCAYNKNYEMGMASSLATGISALGDEVAGVFVCLGDMPAVDLALLEKLGSAFLPAEGKDIVVPSCGPRRGHPVLFGARHFRELVLLKGDVGARSVLSHNEEAIVEVEAGNEALLDLDDPSSFASEG